MLRVRRHMSHTFLLFLGLVALFLVTRSAPLKADGPWSNLGSNANGTDGAIGTPSGAHVNAIAVSGTDVYVAGNFTNAEGDTAADSIAKWNGTAWVPLGSVLVCDPVFGGCHPEGLFNGAEITSIAIWGTDVYVGGPFVNQGGVGANNIAKWDTLTSTWSALGNNGGGGNGLNNTVKALAVSASGNLLYVGGVFRNAGGVATADAIATWDGSNWGALGSYLGDGAILCTQLDVCKNNTTVNAIAVDGTNVYVGCTDCRDVGGDITADNIVMWDGSSWHGLGSDPSNFNGTNGAIWETSKVLALQMGPDGLLYVGGNFSNVAGDLAAARLATWDGSQWASVGASGGNSAIPNGDVRSLAFFGPDLYVAGGFSNANGSIFADGIIKWSGGVWSALGSNGSSGALSAGLIWVAVVTASPTDIYVGGTFFDAGGVATADNLARWNIVPPGLTSIVVTPAAPIIPAGTTQQFTATGGYSDGSTADISGKVTWASATTSVATTDTSGLAHGIAVGASLISATKGVIGDSKTLTVNPPTLVNITVTPVTPTIASGANLQFTATGTYSDSSTANLTATATWGSATPGVATIGATTGLAHGASNGTSVISASYGGKSGNTTLTVGGPVPVLTYTGPTAAAPGAAITLSATLKTSGGTAISGRTITFHLNGAVLTASTNTKGTASAKTTAPGPGSYPVQVDFAGDPSFSPYSPATTSASLKVSTATKLTYTGPTRASAGTPITLSATLATSAGGGIANKTVTFTFNGTPSSATTNGSGVASVGTTAPAAGKYPIAVSFAGDSAYGAASTSSTLTVR